MGLKKPALLHVSFVFYQVVLVKSRLRAFNRCLAAGWQETRGFEYTPDVLDRHPGSLSVWCINPRYPSEPVIFSGF